MESPAQTNAAALRDAMMGHNGWLRFCELQLPKRIRDGRRFIMLVEVLHVEEAEDSPEAAEVSHSPPTS